MFSSMSASKSAAVAAPRSRQQSNQSQPSDVGGEEELDPASTNHQSGSVPRRKVNRSNPQLSYAYGAPSDGTKAVKKPRNSKEVSVEVQHSPSPSPAPPTSEQSDAASRYKAIKQRQQQLQNHQSPSKAASSSVQSPRRSARLSANGSQDGVAPQDRRRAIASIEEDQAVEEEGEEEERASSSASLRKRRLQSPGQSRSVNAHVSSFYLDATRGDDDDGKVEGGNGLPTSLLRGAQRPPHGPPSPDLSGPGMNSIRSSEVGDSRSHDYAEEERYAQLMEQSQRTATASSWSPKSWFLRRVAKDAGTEETIGETSLERKRRKARTSADNLLYRPEQEVQSESDSGTSVEGRKHSHRKKRIDVKSARGGRDDKKIWMTGTRRRGTKRGSLGGGDAMSGEEEETREQDVDEIEGEANHKTERRGSQQASLWGTIPLWALALSTLVILASLALNLRTLSNDPLDHPSVSGLLIPSSAPKSLSEASERIVKLESAFEALKVAGSSAAKEERRLASRLTHLESETDKASRRFSESQSAMQNHVRMTEAESGRIKAEMGRLQSRLESVHANTHAEDVATSNALKKRLSILESQMKQTDKQLSEIAERTREVERVSAEASKSIAWLEKKLPAEVAVPVSSSSGQPSLDAATWQQLRALFVSKEDADFQRNNERAIRALSLETLEDKIKTGVILSRQAFLQLLQTELDGVKASMEDRFNANAGEMQNDILAKVRAQQDMFEKSGSWKAAQRTSSQEALQFKDGADAKEAIVTLIEAALDVFAADRIGRRDYALYSAGARVIPSLTSPTYMLPSRSRFGWSRKSADMVKPPVVALHHDSSPGMCWPFAGDDGQLGIGLARKVIVSDITLEHVPAFISLEAGSSAPRDVTVWALVERKEDRRRLMAHRTAQTSGKSGDDGEDGDAYMQAPAPIPPSNNHLLLASFTYDVQARAIQTYPVSNEARQLAIPVSVVQVRVMSNHGNKDFTCLYRVRIHGQEWTWDDEQAARTQAVEP